MDGYNPHAMDEYDRLPVDLSLVGGIFQVAGAFRDFEDVVRSARIAMSV